MTSGARGAAARAPGGTRSRALAAVTALALAAVTALALAACAGDDEGTSAAPDRPLERQPTARPFEAPPCPPAIEGCRRASGRIVYVERVDPDGDGDAHFVLLSSQSITAPGVTVVDVKRSLRPRPLPGIGDRLAAAGPVFEGSFGQTQIEAVAIRVRR